MKQELVCLSLLAGAAAYALDFRQGGLSGSQAEAIHGTLLASSDQGARWREVIPGAVDQGTWLKTQAGSEAVVSLSNEAHLRMPKTPPFAFDIRLATGLKLRFCRDASWPVCRPTVAASWTLRRGREAWAAREGQPWWRSTPPAPRWNLWMAQLLFTANEWSHQTGGSFRAK